MTYQLECKKDGLRQTQDGLWKLTLTVHPDDMPVEILKAPPGAHYIAVFADYDGGEPQEEQHRKWEDVPRTEQAGIRCNEEAFMAWLGFSEPHEAARHVRVICGVESRKELNTDTRAGKVWDKLDREFQLGIHI